MQRLGVILVLATLALPAASALGEEAFDAADAAELIAWDTVGYVVDQLPPIDLSGDETRQEEAARENEEAQHSAPAEQEPQQAPPQTASDRARSQRSDAGVVRHATRLLPVPVSSLGAAPRVDVAYLTSAVSDLSPLAPAPAPSRAPAPVAPQGSAVAPAAAPQLPGAGPTGAEVVVAGMVTAAAATASAPAASLLWERLRRLGFVALLYSRIAKERLLDHGSRERLLDAIRARPGLAVADLAEITGTPRNTVTYHLRVLERESLVSSTRNGRNRLFFAPGSLPQRQQADALATLRHETTLAVARVIGAQPGVDQKALCERIGLSPSLAHWHADRLVASGLVDKRREGRFVRYYPGASYELVAARSA